MSEQRQFDLIWRDGAYYVSVPNLLREGERLRVLPVEDYEALRAAVGAAVDHHERCGFVGEVEVKALRDLLASQSRPEPDREGP